MHYDIDIVSEILIFFKQSYSLRKLIPLQTPLVTSKQGNRFVRDMDAPAKWYWLQIYPKRDISVNLVEMLRKISVLSFDL